ncbi:hypothetical protein ACGFZ3_15575 [Stenotrophomonas sp. NPDC047960]|uniref:hypothetical protein n=1 Tax=Stenotrophomonas sp. NPDC047960 TaxID=3364531 RepID=UPI003713BB65
MTNTQGKLHQLCATTKFLITVLVGALFAPAAQAINATQWQAVAPAIQAAVECRAKPDTTAAAWKALPRDESGGIEAIKPPVPFTVFGLPVQEVSIFIDPDGELGESYTATLGTNAAAVRKAAKLSTAGGRTTTMGELMLSDGGAPQLTCTVAGTYDESDYQEN